MQGSLTATRQLRRANFPSAAFLLRPAEEKLPAETEAKARDVPRPRSGLAAASPPAHGGSEADRAAANENSSVRRLLDRHPEEGGRAVRGARAAERFMRLVRVFTSS